MSNISKERFRKEEEEKKRRQYVEASVERAKAKDRAQIDFEKEKLKFLYENKQVSRSEAQEKMDELKEQERRLR